MSARTSTPSPAKAPAPAHAAALRDPRELIDAFWRAIALILVAKALVFGAVWLGYQQIDLAPDLNPDGTPVDQPVADSFAARFRTWDASHYLKLAEDGYSRDLDLSNAFAPALPLLIRGVSQLTRDPLVAGLLVANVASTAACFLLFVFVRKHWGAATAWWALLLLLAFPTAFYLSLVYSEAVFLLLAVAVFYCTAEALESPYSRRGRLLLAVATAAAFLMPLTRPVGVAVALPMALALLWHSRPHDPALPWRLKLLPRVLLAAAPLVGVAAQLAYMQAATGDALAHVDAQALYVAQWDVANLLRPWVFADELLGRSLSLHGTVDSALDRAFFLGFLASAPLVYRRVSLPLFLLYASLGLLPPLLGSFMAYTRFLLVAFPLFIAWGDYLKARPRLTRNVVALMGLMQVAMLLAHTSGRWVA